MFIDERAAGANMLALRLFLEYVIGSDHRMAGVPMYAQGATNARRLKIGFKGTSPVGAQASSSSGSQHLLGKDGLELGSWTSLGFGGGFALSVGKLVHPSSWGNVSVSKVSMHHPGLAFARACWGYVAPISGVITPASIW